MIEIIDKPFDGVFVLDPQSFYDERGFFLESYQVNRYKELGIIDHFVQENHSRSFRNVLRGLHFTKNKPQSQILTVLRGRIFDVVVDIRKGSSTFGKWHGLELSDKGPRQIYMSHGFAHGFCVMSDEVDLHYKVSQFYDLDDNFGLLWCDPTLKIKWPITSPLISKRDLQHPYLSRIKL